MAGPQTSFYSRGIQVIFPGHLAPNYSPRIHTKSGPKNGTAFWPKNGSTKGEAPQWGITFCGPVFGPESGPVFWDRILVQRVPDSMAHALMALQDGLRFVPHSILQTRHMYVVFSQVGYMYECCC